MEHTSSVRRPESGTWQSVAMETAAMGGRTGTHERLWTWQQHEEAVSIGAHGRLGAWQQLWEARNLPAPYDKKWNTPAV
ncbi:unnamed protein product [Staurois parvus]|uniref:DUF4113 domain-containing protein n=1 Tax=Staurois parvus TaxID=386267 RepID=A0ABN9DIV0_9NEOB|nr:unnamed protein product [Staurois parvus]